MKDYSLRRAATTQAENKAEMRAQAEADEYEPTPAELLMPEVRQLDERNLAALRHELDILLDLDIAGMDLGKEIVLQYRQGKALLAEVQVDKTVPANQQAQLFNTLRAQLTEIFKQQEVIWSMQRLKKYEVAFVKASNLLTPEAKTAFMSLYGTYLKELAGE